MITTASALHAARAAWRIWAPFVAAALCLLSTLWAPPFAGFLAIIAALALLMDGFAVLAARGSNLRDYRQ